MFEQAFKNIDDAQTMNEAETRAEHINPAI